MKSLNQLGTLLQALGLLTKLLSCLFNMLHMPQTLHLVSDVRLKRLYMCSVCTCVTDTIALCQVVTETCIAIALFAPADGFRQAYHPHPEFSRAMWAWSSWKPCGPSGPGPLGVCVHVGLAAGVNLWSTPNRALPNPI